MTFSPGRREYYQVEIFYNNLIYNYLILKKGKKLIFRNPRISTKPLARELKPAIEG